MLPGNHMSTPLRSLEAQMAALSPTEKVQALTMLALQVADVWPGIERTPEVAGGSACIVRTRIPVWTLERYRQLGWTEARLLESFPTLRAVDLVGARAYVEAHRDEVEQDIHSNEAA
jgi:uncharacterized protein (DUF433 family)